MRIVAKLEPEYIDRLTGGSFQARQIDPEKTDKRAKIKLTKAVYDLLMAEPFKSGKWQRTFKLGPELKFF